MICQNCDLEHSIIFGSGRFCSNKCAKSFSTKHKRQEINQKVKQTLKGRRTKDIGFFKKGFDSNRFVFTEESRKKAIQANNEKLEALYSTITFEQLPPVRKRKIIFSEQNDACLHCKNTHWLEQPIILELDHIDGNKTNNSRSNLRLLCPNCHSYTPTWRKKKKK